MYMVELRNSFTYLLKGKKLIKYKQLKTVRVLPQQNNFVFRKNNVTNIYVQAKKLEELMDKLELESEDDLPVPEAVKSPTEVKSPTDVKIEKVKKTEDLKSEDSDVSKAVGAHTDAETAPDKVTGNPIKNDNSVDVNESNKTQNEDNTKS